MPIARRLISTASFDPDTVRLLGEIFDRAWAALAPEFPPDPLIIPAARTRLAIFIIDLSKDGQLGPDQVLRTASRLVRTTSPPTTPVVSKKTVKRPFLRRSRIKEGPRAH